MKTFTILLLCAVLAASMQGAQGQDKTCKAAISDMLKYQMQAITKCTKQLGFKGKEKNEKMNCIMKCVMIASGALRADGKIEIENAMSFVLEFLPLDVLEKALTGAMKCQRFMDALDPVEPTCSTYAPFVKCLTGFIMSLCNK